MGTLSLATQQTMKISNPTFLKSAATLNSSPRDHGIEVAFVGRSNAGKSSALNSIVGKNSLARTSKTPGRTQLINYFEVDELRRLVDLPGLGYAKVPERVKIQIEKMLSEYLSLRQSLYGLIFLMDIRRPLYKDDQQLIDYALQLNKPIHILLTKCDKLNRGAANQVLLQVTKKLTSLNGDLSVQTFSSLKHIGIEQVRDLLEDWFNSE